MTLEVQHPYQDQLRILVNNTILCFSLYEFAIVIGLKCIGNEDDINYSDLPSCRLQKKYFPYLIANLVYKNLSPSPQELNQLNLPNPVTFGPTDHGENVAPAISVQQETERTSPIEILHEFDYFSTLPNTELLKKMMLEVAHSPMHESEKDIPNREGDPYQSLNEHNIDAKSDNVVEDAGQSSKVGVTERGVDECLKKAESTYTDKVQEEDRHNTTAEIDEGIRDKRLKNSEEDLHKTNKDLSKIITLYVPPLPAAYPKGITDSQSFITDSAIAAIDICNLQGNTDS
ncbi:hypothetical protein FXO38_10687 [Capsicum annuum]|nr:hypothetical protein FXO38_10687 [Capsicum annuum]KAF3665998.1 hypothetical protein FXO37_10787 [Capsicum annuum]